MMQKMLEIADEIVFAKTGKHLDDLQQAIIRGTLQGKRYIDIAAENNFAEKHVKDAGRKLWKILSDILEENISKSNLKATFEKIYTYNSPDSDVIQANFNSNYFNSINFCTTPYPDGIIRRSQHEQQVQAREDLNEAPRRENIYGRMDELEALEKEILKTESPLVTLLGAGGIGKTTLAVKLVAAIKSKFDFIIWRSLSTLPTLEETITNIVDFISHPETTDRNNLDLLKHYLRKYRCLIIIDDVQTIFMEGKLPGTYKSGYENYGSWFKNLGEVSHRSCLLLLSREEPRETALLSNCFSSRLSGLGVCARKILKEKGLSGQKQWDRLIEIYKGNPLYLKIVAKAIEDLFSGEVNDFLNYSQSFLIHDIYLILKEQLQRLSPSEINLIQLLAEQNKTVSLTELKKVKSVDLVRDVESLKRRSLLETQSLNGEIWFHLDPLVKEFAKVQENDV